MGALLIVVQGVKDYGANVRGLGSIVATPEICVVFLAFVISSV